MAFLRGPPGRAVAGVRMAGTGPAQIRTPAYGAKPDQSGIRRCGPEAWRACRPVGSPRSR
ncbi:hypothetical protein ACFFX0_01240 [Citricoccus parietis]|uniref:Uncharacterized protein n=1 Tax=Citricoccus parietis TaxID=592307 RepID=A0ABV5FT78_9MICC